MKKENISVKCYSNSTNNESFSARLVAICQQKGILNARRLAGYLNENRSDKWKYLTVRKWWIGESIPDIDTLKIICDTLDVSADYFIYRIDKPTQEMQTLSDLTGLGEDACKILLDKNSGFLDMLQNPKLRRFELVCYDYGSEKDYREILSNLLTMPEFAELIKKILEIKSARFSYDLYDVYKNAYPLSEDEFSEKLTQEHKNTDTVVNALKYEIFQKLYVNIIEKITKIPDIAREPWFSAPRKDS